MNEKLLLTLIELQIKNNARMEALIETVIEKENIDPFLFHLKCENYEEEILNKLTGKEKVKKSKEETESQLNEALLEILNSLPCDEREKTIKRFDF